jgi:hypothetical protein
MSDKYKLDVENTIIEVEYAGIVDFSERKEAIKQGVFILQDREYPRILINLVGAEMQLSKKEKVELAKYVSEQYALIQVKTAFLIRCEQTEREEIDNAVVRPDEVNSHVFYSRTKALEWLSN